MRLNTIKAAAGASTRGIASAAASAAAGARPPVAATRARSRAPAASTRSASRAGRCRCSGACPSAASPRSRARYIAEVRLSDLAAPAHCGHRPAALKEAGLVPAVAKTVQGDQDRQAGQGGDAARSVGDEGARRDRGGRRPHRGTARHAGRLKPLATSTLASRGNASAEERNRKYADLKQRCCSCCWRSSSIASARTFRCPASIAAVLDELFRSAAGRHPGPVQHVLGRRPVALLDLRARHHALHLGVDHHAVVHGVVPTLEALKKEGESGRRKITQYTRYATRRPGALPVAGHRHRARIAGCRPGHRAGHCLPPHLGGDRW